jgi:DNA-binding transcriptional regulator YdaS (Cro superfamily)
MGFKINRKDWKEDLPPKKFQILTEDAINCVGNANRLANALGITRAAVYQWSPRYRADPFMPLKMAIRFMDNKELRKALKEYQAKKTPAGEPG